MNTVEIPDGVNTSIHFNIESINAVRCATNNRTWVFLRGEEDAWKVNCEINEVLRLIKEAQQSRPTNDNSRKL